MLESEGLGYRAVISYILKRIDQNKNAIIVVNGATGSGKSYTSLRIAEDVSRATGRTFTIKDNVAFNFSTLLKQIKESNLSDDSAGRVFVFEEVGSFGSGASSKQWQSKLNLFFNSFLQTARHRQQIFILNCPYFSNLDASSRKLAHMQIECMGFNPQTKKGLAKAYRIQVNTRNEDMYFKFLRVIHNGLKSKVKSVAVSLATPELLKEYELVKKNFTNQLNATLEDEIAKSDAKKSKAELKDKVGVSKSDHFDIKTYKTLKAQGLKDVKIAKVMDFSVRTLHRYKRKNLLDKMSGGINNVDFVSE